MSHLTFQLSYCLRFQVSGSPSLTLGLVQGVEDWPLGFDTMIPWGCLGKTTSLRWGSLALMSLGSLCWDLSHSHRLNRTSDSLGASGKSLSGVGASQPGLPLALGMSDVCLGPGPQTVHPFSCWGGARAALWPVQEGRGRGREGHALLLGQSLNTTAQWRSLGCRPLTTLPQTQLHFSSSEPLLRLFLFLECPL